MAPVILAARADRRFNVKVLVTGQHRAMLDQVLNLFRIQPDYDLNLMKDRQTLNDILIGVASGLEKLLSVELFDCVLVHGDTTTAMAASLAAFHRKIKIAHVEAGLRTYNIYSPWPEEMNRQFVGRIANFHFSPTNESRCNLLNEKISEQDVYVTGNTVVDALLMAVDEIRSSDSIRNTLKAQFSNLDFSKKMILVTGHRRENFGDNFSNICQALREIATTIPDIQIVYPVHLNPQVREPVHQILGSTPNVLLIEPQEYLPFVYLMMNSFLILTDSGGVQEEAPSLGKPVLVMRENTERPEAVSAGTVKLVGTKADDIVGAVKVLLSDTMAYAKMVEVKNPYGDGKSSMRILNILAEKL